MTEMPTPPASGAPPPRPTPPPRPPHTILGRLAEAVRQQNWVAVAIEVAVVVIGVLIAFQVNAWGADRADRTQERVYLLQLENDLEETLANLAATDSAMAGLEVGSAQLLRAFQRAAPPPRDSLLAWLGTFLQWTLAQPVTETAETLVSTGDLRLIQSDDLQAEIPRYVAFMEEWEGYQTRNFESGVEGLYGLRSHYDYVEVYRFESDRGRLPGMFETTLTPPWEEGGTAPFPLDPSAFLSSRGAYTNTVRLYSGARFLRANRGGMRRGTEEMLALVRSEITALDAR